jgi:(2Fe-2S) ferredoxin
MSYFTHHVFCCENRREAGHSRGCCAEKGSAELREYLKDKIKSLGLNGAGKIRINSAGCLDRCELGPVIVVYPAGIWYHLQTREDADAIIHEHLIGGEIVERLRLAEGKKRL